MEHLLSDGHRVLIRPIGPGDKAELAAGLTQLSDLSVQRRFLSPKRRFTSAELRYLTEVDGHDHAAFVAEVRNGQRGRVAAVARWVRLADRSDTADVAIVVADLLQGRGLGSLLADRLAETAVHEGIKRFSATMLSDNRAAHRLMERLSTRLARSPAGTGQEELLATLAS